MTAAFLSGERAAVTDWKGVDGFKSQLSWKNFKNGTGILPVMFDYWEKSL